MRKLIEELIKYRSDKEHLEELFNCFDFVEKYLLNIGLKVKTYKSNGFPSLIAGKTIKKHYRFLLVGHLDVVPGNDEDFKPKIRGSIIYGRGTSDMKGPIAASIKMFEDKNLKNTDFALMLTGDEEIGGFNGAKYLLENGYSSDCAVIPDGGKYFTLTIVEKGIIQIKITAKGKSAHGSRPWLGENAIEKLHKIYSDIKSGLKETSKENRWLPTVNLGKIQGGLATNVVPDMAEMYLDFRYPEEEHEQMILELVKKSTEKFSPAEYTVLLQGNLMSTPADNPFLKKAIASAEKYGIDLSLNTGHGASDGRFFSAKGIPVVMFKPECSESHIDNEWIDLKSLEKFSLILKDFLLTK